MRLLVNVFALTLAWFSVSCADQRDKLFFLQKSTGDLTETLLVVTWTETEDEINAGCEIFKDKDLINRVLKSSKGVNIRTLSGNDIDNLLEDCTETTVRRRRRESTSEMPSVMDIMDDFGSEGDVAGDYGYTTDYAEDEDNDTMNAPGKKKTTKSPNTTEPPLKPGYDGWPVIFPGTKWCGAGDIAKHYDDLGVLQDTDRCCRAHDLCNDTLAPGETRHNLTNKSTFTKLSCECDQDFYDCLDRVNTVIGNTIGNMYFNLLKRECYDKDYPTTKKCKKYRTIFKIKCAEYEKDTSAKKVYQWIPAKRYKKIPFPGPITVTLPF